MSTPAAKHDGYLLWIAVPCACASLWLWALHLDFDIAGLHGDDANRVSLVSPLRVRFDSAHGAQVEIHGDRSTAAAKAAPPSESYAQPFAGLQARWESVWSIEASSAERNEANIDRAADLRDRAEQGDLDAVVELIGAASWCASAGPLSSRRDGADGTRLPPCFERFGADIASHKALEWTIFRWTMMLANAGFQDALLYASVRGRDQLFVPPLTVDPEVVASLRSQLIGQLKSMVASGSADAASELNSYYMKAVEFGESAAVEARYYADLTERLDPERTGLTEVTDDWIATLARARS